MDLFLLCDSNLPHGLSQTIAESFCLFTKVKMSVCFETRRDQRIWIIYQTKILQSAKKQILQRPTAWPFHMSDTTAKSFCLQSEVLVFINNAVGLVVELLGALNDPIIHHLTRVMRKAGFG